MKVILLILLTSSLAGCGMRNTTTWCHPTFTPVDTNKIKDLCQLQSQTITMQHPRQPILDNCQTESMNTGLTCEHNNSEKMTRYDKSMDEYNNAKENAFNACMYEIGYTTAPDNQCYQNNKGNGKDAIQLH